MKNLIFLFFISLTANLSAREMILVRIEAKDVTERTEIANYIHIDTVQKGFITAHVNTEELKELQKNIKQPIEVLDVLYTGTKEFVQKLSKKEKQNSSLLKTENKVFTIKRKLQIPKGKKQEIPLKPLLTGFDILNKDLKLEAQKEQDFSKLNLTSDQVLELETEKSLKGSLLVLTATSEKSKQNFKVEISIDSF